MQRETLPAPAASPSIASNRPIKYIYIVNLRVSVHTERHNPHTKEAFHKALIYLIPANRIYVAEAKDAMIYELDLSSLTTVNSTSTNQKNIKRHEIAAYISRVSPYIIE